MADLGIDVEFAVEQLRHFAKSIEQNPGVFIDCQLTLDPFYAEPRIMSLTVRTEVKGGWRTIETAPRSARILVCGGTRNVDDGYHDVQTAWIDGLGNVWADDRKEGSAPIKPTYWMPLAAPQK